MIRQKNISLREFTTIKIGGTAADFFLPETREELAAVLSVCPGAFILGGGSNLVLGDFSARAVVSLRALAGGEPRVITEEDGRARVRVGGGYLLPELVRWAAERGLGGLEILAGIPGTVGGAAVMNAGTPGGSFGDYVLAVEIFHAGELRTVTDLGYAYRASALQAGGALAGAAVVSVELALASGRDAAALRAVARAVTAKRASGKIRFPNCGSVFRNPPGGLSAGALLEKAGMKGESAGNLYVSETHANFFENRGGATFADFCELLARAQARVREDSGVELVPEVQVVSDAD